MDSEWSDQDSPVETGGTATRMHEAEPAGSRYSAAAVHGSVRCANYKTIETGSTHAHPLS